MSNLICFFFFFLFLPFQTGACVLLACIAGDVLVIANVGDSRAVLATSKAGSPYELTARYVGQRNINCMDRLWLIY